ncbi:hypothetical protein [Marinobacter vinifirmus]|uniref:hypothetical protein n=1 Tax=Marinobacter vinifirmus TaxID=355591 RepID=UPI0012B697DC|nr:hypothetical protein [Marinobacter vinifirmus]
MSETLICVVEDVGVRVWLERVLEDEWSLEFVSASDLSRVAGWLRQAVPNWLWWPSARMTRKKP